MMANQTSFAWMRNLKSRANDLDNKCNFSLWPTTLSGEVKRKIERKRRAKGGAAGRKARREIGSPTPSGEVAYHCLRRGPASTIRARSGGWPSAHAWPPPTAGFRQRRKKRN